MIYRVEDAKEKAGIARLVLEDLEDWFGIEESREMYIRQSREQPFFACKMNGVPVGFLCLKETGRDTVEIAVMGVCRDLHRQGVGKQLFCAAKAYAQEQGYTFMQVKTVQMGRYDDYDETNRFYMRMGFREFEVFPTLWDENNPCQIYVIAI